MPASADHPDPGSLAERIPAWRGAENLTIEPVAAGLSNRSYLVTAGGDRYVLRMPARTGPGPDPAVGFAAHRTAAAVGLAPEVVHADAGTGLLVTQWVAGERFDEAQLERPAQRARLADVLTRLHRLPPPPERHRPLEVAESLWAWYRRYAEVDGELARWRDAYQAEAPALVGGLEPDCLCHLDLVGANVLDTGDRLVLLDFEWAAAGDALMDLAFIASSADLSPAATDALLVACGRDGAGQGDKLHRLRRLADHLSAHWYLARSVGPGGTPGLVSTGLALVRKLLRRRLHSG